VGDYRQALSRILQDARRGDAAAWVPDIACPLIAMLEVKLIDRARKGWAWQVCDHAGAVLAHGRQKTRLAAKYQAERALFQLLAVGWKSKDLKRAGN
jgi:hypothetical protein